MKVRYTVPALLTAVVLVLSGCAKSSPPNPTPSSSVAAFKACMLSDEGGFDDKSFNETSYNGLVRAEKELGVSSAKIQSLAKSDYVKNVQALLDVKCDLIIGVGFALAGAIEASAKANLTVKYALVDAQLSNPLPNVKPLVFNTNEPSFLAGYLSAALTKSGKVATFGGAKYPPVTIFMDGYVQGVKQYNKVKGKRVQLIGWDLDKQDGQFIQSASPFTDVSAGYTTAQNQISQGADVLFPVAGLAGMGALQAAQSSNGGVSVIWGDADGCVSVQQYCQLIPTSVYKAMDLAVFEVVKSMKDNTFTNTSYIGGLKNSGTGLMPYHTFESKLSNELKTEIAALREDVALGKIVVNSPSINK